MRRIASLALLAAAGAVLGACEPAASPSDTAPAEQTATETAAPVTPAQPSGPSQTIEAEAEPMPAAWVTDVHFVKDADVKLFSTAGGDPAINGLYTYLALYTPPEGWTRVFMVGDFDSWEVIEESPSRVVLKVRRSWIDEATGDVKSGDEKLILDVPADEASPLTVTPAT